MTSCLLLFLTLDRSIDQVYEFNPEADPPMPGNAQLVLLETSLCSRDLCVSFISLSPHLLYLLPSLSPYLLYLPTSLPPYLLTSLPPYFLISLCWQVLGKGLRLMEEQLIVEEESERSLHVPMHGDSHSGAAGPEYRGDCKGGVRRYNDAYHLIMSLKASPSTFPSRMPSASRIGSAIVSRSS